MELNESKMNKMQYYFHPKIHIFIVYANIHSSGLVKIKRPTTSTLPHVNKVISPVKIQTLAVSTPSV